MAQREFTVTRGSATRREVEAYLYDHSAIVSESKSEFGSPAFRIRTTSNESDARAQWLADYQADRFSSGMFGVQRHW